MNEKKLLSEMKLNGWKENGDLYFKHYKNSTTKQDFTLVINFRHNGYVNVLEGNRVHELLTNEDYDLQKHLYSSYEYDVNYRLIFLPELLDDIGEQDETTYEVLLDLVFYLTA